jgi:hypothetical protein
LIRLVHSTEPPIYTNDRCHGNEVDGSFLLLVLNALQGHPEYGALWEKHINKILNDLDIA